MTLNDWILQAETSKLEFIKKYDKGWSPIEDITHLPFIEIKKNIPELMGEGKFDEAISIILSEPTTKTLKRDDMERFRLLIWIEKQYIKINQMEKRYLERPPDFKLLGAGIKNLDILGIINIVDMLALGDVTKWKTVEQLPYSVCFEKQLKTVIEGDIQKKMIEQSKSNVK